jgi:hypothetical protein
VLNPELLGGDATSFVDATTRSGVAYTYVPAAVKENGDQVLSIPVVVRPKPLAFELEPNVPNPFNPSTRIAFKLPEAERAIMRLYDVRGAHVATVVDSRLSAGRHLVDWNGVDDGGAPAASAPRSSDSYAGTLDRTGRIGDDRVRRRAREWARSAFSHRNRPDRLRPQIEPRKQIGAS